MKNKFFIFLLTGLVLFDQLTKYLFYEKYFDLVIFKITFLKNTGMSFGLFQNSNLIFVFISIIALFLLLYFRKEFNKHKTLFVVILSGIIGNLVDRIFRGFVVDFINFGWWPVFNFADSFIFIGVLGILIKELFYEKASSRHKKKV